MNKTVTFKSLASTALSRFIHAPKRLAVLILVACVLIGMFSVIMPILTAHALLAAQEAMFNPDSSVDPLLLQHFYWLASASGFMVPALMLLLEPWLVGTYYRQGAKTVPLRPAKGAYYRLLILFLALTVAALITYAPIFIEFFDIPLDTEELDDENTALWFDGYFGTLYAATARVLLTFIALSFSAVFVSALKGRWFSPSGTWRMSRKHWKTILSLSVALAIVDQFMLSLLGSILSAGSQMIENLLLSASTDSFLSQDAGLIASDMMIGEIITGVADALLSFLFSLILVATMIAIHDATSDAA